MRERIDLLIRCCDCKEILGCVLGQIKLLGGKTRNGKRRECDVHCRSTKDSCTIRKRTDIDFSDTYCEEHFCKAMKCKCKECKYTTRKIPPIIDKVFDTIEKAEIYVRLIGYEIYETRKHYLLIKKDDVNTYVLFKPT